MKQSVSVYKRLDQRHRNMSIATDAGGDEIDNWDSHRKKLEEGMKEKIC